MSPYRFRIASKPSHGFSGYLASKYMCPSRGRRIAGVGGSRGESLKVDQECRNFHHNYDYYLMIITISHLTVLGLLLVVQVEENSQYDGPDNGGIAGEQSDCKHF